MKVGEAERKMADLEGTLDIRIIRRGCQVVTIYYLLVHFS